tara:strand:- start:779 stop:925 length:147 start_codon:yes stop_codon:yes gene_type:complete
LCLEGHDGIAQLSDNIFSAGAYSKELTDVNLENDACLRFLEKLAKNAV